MTSPLPTPTTSNYVLSGGTPVTINDQNKLAEGREAAIYAVGKNQVAKIYFDSKSPQFKGFPQEQVAADQRIADLAVRLKDYPKTLSNFYANPTDVVYKKQQIVGYLMPRITGGQQYAFYLTKDFIDKGVRWNLRKNLLSQIVKGVEDAHQQQVILGDGMSPRNFEVDAKHKVWGVDTLSYQYGKHYCLMLTDKVVDPRVLIPGKLDLQVPYDKENDWYGLYVLSFEAVTFTNPYGGLFPLKARKDLGATDTDRRRLRLTVFDPRITYPKGLPHWSVFPEDLLDIYFTTFTTDTRNPFPLKLWEDLTPRTCSKCGLEHFRQTCPSCTQVAPPAVKQKTQITQSVRADMLLQTTGYILQAFSNNGELEILVQESQLQQWHVNYPDARIRRSYAIQHQQGNKYRINSTQLMIGVDQDLYAGQQEWKVDSYRGTTAFDVSKENVYVLQGGNLKLWTPFKNGTYVDKHLRDFVTNNTYIWTNTKFGFGFSEAEQLITFFGWSTDTNNPANIKQKDGKYLFSWPGTLQNSICYISNSLIWLFIQYTATTGDKYRCYIIDPLTNKVLEDNLEDQEWIGTQLTGKAVVNDSILVPTDNGIVSYNYKTKAETLFEATANYINTTSKLFLSFTGIYVLNSKQVWHLQLS